MKKNIHKTAWIAADWGTTHIRVWAIDVNDNILAYSESDKGMKYLQKNEFEPVLLRLIENWLDDTKSIPVVTCGMVGARQGWVETPYNSTPCNPINIKQVTFVTTKDSRIKVVLVPGLMQKEPSDIIRGEETQIAGFLKFNPNFDGIICLPGTHVKWVKVNNGIIEKFTTFMTGELFGVISHNTLISHNISSEGWCHESFEKGLIDGYSYPGLFASNLFALRAKSILNGLDSNSVRAMLSGILIGVELKGAKDYWVLNNVVLIGSDLLTKNYQTAINLLGQKAKIFSVESATLAGLSFVHSKLKLDLE